MPKKNKFCQSCGMPLNKDPQVGGSEKDGSKSLIYCSYCYADGKFTQPNITIPEMKDLVINEMKKMGMPGFVAKLFARGIPKLQRWQTK
jgi:hypothetical protein